MIYAFIYVNMTGERDGGRKRLREGGSYGDTLIGKYV